jgi:hypothetical protein
LGAFAWIKSNIMTLTDEEYVLARFHKEIKAELTTGREDQDLVAWSDSEIASFIEWHQIELDQAVKAYIKDMDGPIDGQEADWFREVLYEYIEITPTEDEHRRANRRQRVAKAKANASAITIGPFGALPGDVISIAQAAMQPEATEIRASINCPNKLHHLHKVENKVLTKLQEMRKLTISDLKTKLIYYGLTTKGSKQSMVQKALTYEIMYDDEIVTFRLIHIPTRKVARGAGAAKPKIRSK